MHWGKYDKLIHLMQRPMLLRMIHIIGTSHLHHWAARPSMPFLPCHFFSPWRLENNLNWSIKNCFHILNHEKISFYHYQIQILCHKILYRITDKPTYIISHYLLSLWTALNVSCCTYLFPEFFTLFAMYNDWWLSFLTNVLKCFMLIQKYKIKIKKLIF